MTDFTNAHRVFISHLLMILALAGCSQPPAADSPALSDEHSPNSPDAPPLAADAIRDLGMEGRLIFSQGPSGLWSVDLKTGVSQPYWEPPAGAQVEGLAASPDGTRLVLAYAPEEQRILRTDLFVTDVETFNPEPLLVHTGQFETYANPFWSPDGDWIYFTHTDVLTDEAGDTEDIILNVERIPADGSGEPEVVFTDAEQVSISSDGAWLAFLRFDQETFGRSLWVARMDGSVERELVPEGTFEILSGLRISPDGQVVAFAASGPPVEPPLGRARGPGLGFGVLTAEAHGLPWEIWTVSTGGGPLQKVTAWQTDSPWPAWSPDGSQLAALQPDGVFVLTGADPLFLAPAAGHGELVWIP